MYVDSSGRHSILPPRLGGGLGDLADVGELLLATGESYRPPGSSAGCGVLTWSSVATMEPRGAVLEVVVRGDLRSEALLDALANEWRSAVCWW